MRCVVNDFLGECALEQANKACLSTGMKIRPSHEEWRDTLRSQHGTVNPKFLSPGENMLSKVNGSIHTNTHRIRLLVPNDLGLL